MYYAVSCYDKKNKSKLRIKTRKKHLIFINNSNNKIILAGPLIGDNQEIIGSHLIIKASNILELNIYLKEDPYNIVNLFERIEIKSMKITVFNTLK